MQPLVLAKHGFSKIHGADLNWLEHKTCLECTKVQNIWPEVHLLCFIVSNYESQDGVQASILLVARRLPTYIKSSTLLSVGHLH